MVLDRVAELAKADPGRKFCSIAHFLTPEALEEAFYGLRKDASAGVDHVRYRDYEGQARQKVHELHERLKNKTYRALPLRRAYIPKEDGKTRPISIPALEDKIVQKAAVRLLSAILRAGLSRLLLRLPPWTRRTTGAGRSRTRHLSRTDIGRPGAGHSLLPRLHRARTSHGDD